MIRDARTIDIELSAPDATFAARMTLGFAAPVCPSSGTVVDVRAPSTPCGAGPFVFEQSAVGQQIRLHRFEGYFEAGKPYLDAVVWPLGVPARPQRYRFEAGDLDLVTDLTGGDAARSAAERRRWDAAERQARWLLADADAPLPQGQPRREIEPWQRDWARVVLARVYRNTQRTNEARQTLAELLRGAPSPHSKVAAEKPLAAIVNQ